jgi:hypothetical protein
MDTWVKNELYTELMGKPLWVVCAFSDNDEFNFGKKEERLVSTILGDFMGRCPASLYDREYHMNVKIAEFLPVVKKAWEGCESWVRNKYDRLFV